MAKFMHLGNDAQGFDPASNPEKVVGIYEVLGRRVAVPATLQAPGQETALEAAIYEAAGIAPSVIQLYQQWEAIKVQAASRPLGTMDLTQAKAWVDANVTNIASAQTALKNVATELFVIRAQMRIIEALFRNVFDA